MAYKSNFSLLVCILSVSVFLNIAISQAYDIEEPKEDRREPLTEYQQCQEKCTKQPSQQQLQCQKRCDEKYKEQQRGGQGDNHLRKKGQENRKEEDDNPYFFHSRILAEQISQEGNISIVERFTRRSNLLKGIENYRITIFGAQPNTFMIPSHRDVDSVCVVLKGLGAISILHKNKKETHTIMAADIFRIPAGATVHFINMHNVHELYILELTIPLNTPGQYSFFYPLSGKDHKSYFSAFSDEILQAAFNAESGQLRKLFQTETKGPFVRASREQIQAITADLSSGPRYAYSSLAKGPIQSNQYGNLYLTRPDRFKPLQDVNVAVSYANISSGGMLGPYYNSRSTMIAWVARGNGYFEMACPHLSQGSGSRSSYQNVRARISRADLFVVPAGHPVAVVNTDEEDNLHIVGIELNGQENQKNPLAGSTNIFKQLQREAKELSFGFPAEQVDEILNRQTEAWFFPAPGKQQVDRA